MVDLLCSLESSNDMGHRKHKRKNKRQLPVLVDLQRERKKARSLGYENTEEYEKGLSTVKRLLAQKNKPSKPETPNA